MNLYGIQNTHSLAAVLYAAENAKHARTYARQDLGWEYWDMENAVLLYENFPGAEGRVSVQDTFEILKVKNDYL